MPFCPTCKCTLHVVPTTWRIWCVGCGKEKWPFQVDAPEIGWRCQKCRLGSERGKRRVGSRRGTPL